MKTFRNLFQTVIAWGVHLFTASGAIISIFVLYALFQNNYFLAFQLLFIAIFIDAVDGSLARLANVKKFANNIDGALMDNIIDFTNYSVIPAFILLSSNMLPSYFAPIVVSFLIISSAYQFSQKGAKSKDHFFVGFPSYWNIVVFYLFIYNTPLYINALIVVILSTLSFIPIKYIYPSRLNYFKNFIWFQKIFSISTILWAVATSFLLFQFTNLKHISSAWIIIYIIFYLLTSLWVTFQKNKDIAIKK